MGNIWIICILVERHYFAFILFYARTWLNMSLKLLQLLDETILQAYVNTVIDHVVKQKKCRNIYPNARHSSEHRAICLFMVSYVHKPLSSCIWKIKYILIGLPLRPDYRNEISSSMTYITVLPSKITDATTFLCP